MNNLKRSIAAFAVAAAVAVAPAGAAAADVAPQGPAGPTLAQPADTEGKSWKWCKPFQNGNIINICWTKKKAKPKPKPQPGPYDCDPATQSCLDEPSVEPDMPITWTPAR